VDSDPRPLMVEIAHLSRESKMHFSCMRAFPEVNGVIHAHPRELSVFAATGRPVHPITDYTEKYGVTEVVPYYPSHSQELADTVVAAFMPRRAAFQKNGLGLILAWHGVVVAGRDLADAYDTLERLEWCAHANLMARLLTQGEPEFYRREG
jgi:L-fuculose-phosphate aldolase